MDFTLGILGIKEVSIFADTTNCLVKFVFLAEILSISGWLDTFVFISKIIETVFTFGTD
jgi:hypothetical protein